MEYEQTNLVRISVGLGYHLSIIQRDPDRRAMLKGVSRVSLVRSNGRWAHTTTIPLRDWTYVPSGYRSVDSVDINDYRSLGYESESALVAHLAAEAERFVKFIEVWRKGDE